MLSMKDDADFDIDIDADFDIDIDTDFDIDIDTDLLTCRLVVSLTFLLSLHNL